MAESKRFSGAGARETEALWNVSLFPTFPLFEPDLTPGGLENADEKRSREKIRRPLRVSLACSGGNLG